MIWQLEFLRKLGLHEIGGFEYIKPLGGGSALSGLYQQGDSKIVLKFLINPRNDIELQRFRLEFSVLNNNGANQSYYEEHNSFVGPASSYPLPQIAHPLSEEFGGMVNYFGYIYEEGTLLSQLDTIDFSVSQKVELLHRIASGLSYFNQIGYEHRDLHPDNILLLPGHKMGRNDYEVNDPRVKILDLGNCQKKDETIFDMFHSRDDVDENIVYQDNNRRLLSSFISMPPDFLSRGEHTKNYDSWSFGIYAYNLLFDELPFRPKCMFDVANLKNISDFHVGVHCNLSTLDIGLKLVLMHLLSPKGEDRPSIHAIVRLLNWVRNEREMFNDPHFVMEVIKNEGIDPYAIHDE